MSKENQPIPQGKYVPATRWKDTIYTAGMTPRRNGKLIQVGKVQLHQDLSHYKEAVRQAAANALVAIQGKLRSQEEVQQILLLNVYIQAEEGFADHAKLADFASEYFVEQLGDVGIGSRAAIGVASLPGNSPIEIQVVASFKEYQS